MAGILIADDSEVVRRTIRELLQWHALFICGEAQDGNEAVEKVRELIPDVVLLDVNMPAMNGSRLLLRFGASHLGPKFFS